MVKYRIVESLLDRGLRPTGAVSFSGANGLSRSETLAALQSKIKGIRKRLKGVRAVTVKIVYEGEDIKFK